MATVFKRQTRRNFIKYCQILLGIRNAKGGRYIVSPKRAHEKAHNMFMNLAKLNKYSGTICMYGRLGQKFDTYGNPINKALKRYNYKDESQYQWAFAIEWESPDVIVHRMLGSNFVYEHLNRRQRLYINESQLRNIIYESVFEVIDNTRMIV